MLDLPAALILGVVGGLLGALFVQIFLTCVVLRKKYITTNARKVWEAVIFVVITTSTFYLTVVLSTNKCIPIS